MLKRQLFTIQYFVHYHVSQDVGKQAVETVVIQDLPRLRCKLFMFRSH